MNKNQVSIIMKEKLNTAINEVCQNPWLFAINPGADFTRTRKMPIRELLRAIFGMRGNSLNKELYDYFKDRDEHITASAFVQQRAKLLPEACKYIFQAFNNACLDTKTYKGYHLYAVDGTDLNIARNENSPTYFPPQKNQDVGNNRFHANALYDLLNRTYKDVYVQPSPYQQERDAALVMIVISRLSGKDIVIADRGYQSYNFFEYLNRIGVKYVVRIKDNDLVELKRLPNMEYDKDVSIELRTTQTKADREAFAAGTAKWIAGHSKNGKTKKQVSWDFESPFLFRYRCVRFEITTGVYETLVTNLSRDEFPLEEMKDLYHMRWGIETSFRELKYAIGLVNFHARKEEYILQEIYARLTIYNFEAFTPYVLHELVKAIYVDAPDKSSGKRRQHIHIQYDGLGFIPLNDLLTSEKA